jgi:16S rRNA (uracil1498-N3)-methyltransferase
MQLFFNSILKPDDNYFCFDKNESRHIVKVLRKEIGDNLLITNGLGCFFEANILTNNPNKCEVKINKATSVPAKEYNIHLAVAPTKTNDRYEWFLEKATEIGVDTVTPIICNRSERKVIKKERYTKILQSAAKQSLRAYFPILNPAIRFSEFVKNNSTKNGFIAHCLDDKKIHLKDAVSFKKDVLILIGPEGDFTSEEIKLAQKFGFKAVSLGNARLRTETAAIVACHTIELCNA